MSKYKEMMYARYPLPSKPSIEVTNRGVLTVSGERFLYCRVTRKAKRALRTHAANAALAAIEEAEAMVKW